MSHPGPAVRRGNGYKQGPSKSTVDTVVPNKIQFLKPYNNDRQTKYATRSGHGNSLTHHWNIYRIENDTLDS